MDSEFEANFELGDKRSKGIKNRRSKEFKRFAKSGTVQKRIVHQRTETGEYRWASKKQHSMLKEVDPFGFDLDIEYSLNKNNRWGKVAEIRRVEQLEDLADNVKVTTVEKVFLQSQTHNKPLTTTYYEVDEWGDHIERRAKHFTAQELTLTEKPRLPKKLRDAAANKSDIEDVAPAGSVHVRYELMTAHPSEKYWRQHYWKLQDRNRSAGKISNTRAKKASLNDVPLNGYDDECSYESESDSYEEDFANSSDHVRRQNEYSLFDFVNDSSKKPKKSERFEFIDVDSVQPLSSDEDSEGGGPSGSVFRPKQIPSSSKNLFTFFTITLRHAAADTSDNNQATDLLPEIQDSNNVNKQAELTDTELSKKYQLIPTSPKRYLFDLSEQITNQKGDKEKLVVILERKTVNKVGITLNGNFVLDNNVSNIRSAILSRSPNNIESLLYSILLHFRQLQKQNAFKVTPNEHRYLPVHKANYEMVPSCFIAQTESLKMNDLMSEAIRRFVDSPHDEFASEQMVTPVDNVCGICCCSIQLKGIAMEKCGHLFCTECWQMHCNQRLRTGHVPIVCPDAACDLPIPLSMLMSLMPIKHFVVFKNILLERYLLEHYSGNITHCPRCNCTINIIVPSGFQTLSCSHCNITWCQMCQMAVHWPLNCAQAALYYDRFDKQKRFLAFWSGERETKVQAKRCPTCKTLMEKGYGCDFMACRCGSFFCWSCLRVLSREGPHYCTHLSPGQKTADHFQTVELRDIKKIYLNNKMAKGFFEKCQEIRTRRTQYGASSKLRKSARRMGATIEERSLIANTPIEALYLTEFAFAWLYVCGKGKLFGAIRSLCDRLEFTCARLEHCCLDGQKNESLKIATDCQALSQQLISSLRDARLIMMQYEEDE